MATLTRDTTLESHFLAYCNQFSNVPESPRPHVVPLAFTGLLPKGCIRQGYLGQPDAEPHAAVPGLGEFRC